MIRPCSASEVGTIRALINDAARVYRGVIPEDRWQDPYMAAQELQREIRDGVAFWGCFEDGDLVGVMGIQPVQDVALIRHAYVASGRQRRGIGARLLVELRRQTRRPILVGTWAAASWAIRFYEKHGFRRVSDDQTGPLLRRYWSIPERQVETSVVLADRAWFARGERGGAT